MTFVERGISWQGPTPLHWRPGPIKRFLRQSFEPVGDAWPETQLLSLTKQGIIRRDPESGEGKFPASFEGYQIIEPDDLVMCLFDMDETPRTVGLCHERGMITSAYTRFHIDPTVADPRFVEWAFIAIDDTKRFRPLYTGLRKVIQKPRLLSAPLALPSIAEQHTIADFLDRQTGAIDALIEKQTQLVERLRERRLAALQALVFGLGGPEHPLPTLIERHLAVEPILSRIPNHWTVRRWKSCLRRIENRNTDLEQPMMSLRTTGEVVDRSTLGQRQEPDTSSLPRYLVVRPGDLVVNPMWLTGGSIGVSEVNGAVSPDYRVFEVRGSHLPRYLHHLLRTRPYLDQYVLYTRAQTTFDRRVQQPDLNNLPLPTPPLREQQDIADRLDRDTAKIDALIAKAERFVELARERRSALIAAAVTGQLDTLNTPERQAS